VAAFAEAARSLPRGGQGAHPSAKTAAARPCASPLHSPTSLPWPRFSPLPPSLTPLARVVPWKPPRSFASSAGAATSPPR